jgi:hypothetical protein
MAKKKPTRLDKYNQWHQTRIGLFTFVIVELAASYGVISLAIHNGNLICWLVGFVLFVQSIKNLVILIGTAFHGKRQTS